MGYEERYAYLLHDRDSIFSAELDESVQRLGLRVLRSPPRSPKANSICERAIGTLRRECLDDFRSVYGQSNTRRIAPRVLTRARVKRVGGSWAGPD